MIASMSNGDEQLRESSERLLETEEREQDKEEKRKKKLERRRAPKQEDDDEIGLDIEGQWVPLRHAKTKQIYAKLVKKRFKADEELTTNHAATTVKNKLTPKQREYWWRTAHKTFMTNDRMHKFKVDEKGRRGNECKMCCQGKETWGHMEYECEEVQKWLRRLEGVYHSHVKEKEEAVRWEKPTLEEWRLEKEEMDEDKIMVIALARWNFHKEWCNVNLGRRRRIDVERLAERVEEDLRSVREKDARDRERRKKEEEEEERRKAKTAEKTREKDEQGE